MDEFEIIAKIFAPLATHAGAFGLADDAAAIAARPGFDLIITTDQIAEGTDFFAHDPAAGVAQKALRVNLSDLAAKGVKPEFYLLALALPASVTMEWLKTFAAGLGEDQKRYGVSLLGGDTGRSEGPLSVTVTAFGFVPEGKMIRRNGARMGDGVYVTGTIGDSGGGLAICKHEKHALSEAERDTLIARYRVPEPPVAFGAVSLRKFASASIDVSDGLIADLGHIAKASRLKVQIEAEAIPRSDALRAFLGDDAGAILRAATAGDDYQVAFTANPALEAQIQFEANIAGVMVTRVGSVTAGQGVELRHKGRVLPVPQPGYHHF